MGFVADIQGEEEHMKRLLVAAAFLAAVMAAGPAQAGYELDFGMVFPTPGTISYAGGASALVGSNIQVDNVVGGMDVPAHSNIMLNLAGGVLDFTTGSLSSYSNGTWDFNGGGTITLMGGIDLNGDGILEIPLGTTLLSGTFDSARSPPRAPASRLPQPRSATRRTLTCWRTTVWAPTRHNCCRATSTSASGPRPTLIIRS